MSIEGKNRIITTQRLLEMKEKGHKIAMITAYDYTSAKIVDKAGIDIILVGDSAANVMAGHETTLPITLEQMENVVSEIEKEILNMMQREVSSDKIGELVMERLKELDEVCYVRFASVYRQFKDINSFLEELKNIMGEKYKI